MSSPKMIVLTSSDGEIFEVPEAVAKMSQTINQLIEDDCADNGIPLPNVTGNILAKVIEYCKKHHELAAGGGDREEKEMFEKELKEFDAKFLNVDDQVTLFDLVLAANYLDIKSLLDLTCQTVADYIKDKSVEQVRTYFNIKNDFTPEEEAAIRKENAWAFDG